MENKLTNETQNQINIGDYISKEEFLKFKDDYYKDLAKTKEKWNNEVNSLKDELSSVKITNARFNELILVVTDNSKEMKEVIKEVQKNTSTLTDIVNRHEIDYALFKQKVLTIEEIVKEQGNRESTERVEPATNPLTLDFKSKIITAFFVFAGVAITAILQYPDLILKLFGY